MTRNALLLVALLGILSATGTTLAALSGTMGYADRIAIRNGYSQYEGKIDLRDSNNVVTFYYWGGTRCAAATDAPTNREIDFLLNAHLSGHSVSLDYDNYSSSYGTSRCWDGGLQIW